MQTHYDVLQVHRKAEPEIIDVAYKKLAFKYHPDKNGSEEIMKRLNAAYEVLSKPDSRRRYDASLPPLPHFDFKNFQSKSKSTNEGIAMDVLREYFRMLQQRHFKEAYDMITLADQKKISLADFTKWQGAVANVFSLKTFELKYVQSHNNACLNGGHYKQIVVFDVITEEWNRIMDTVERDALEKQVVQENGKFKVYMGIDTIYKLIEKYETLSQLADMKKEWWSNHRVLPSILSERVFLYNLQKEQTRVERYGGRFSLMLISLNSSTYPRKELVGSWLKKAVRQVDTIGFDKQGHYIILMPETSLVGAIKAAEKIKRGLERTVLDLNGVICVEPFTGSIEKTLESLYQLKHRPFKKGVSLAFNRKLR